MPETQLKRRCYDGDQETTQVVKRPGFTKFYGVGAIYSLTPVSEDLARAAAARFDSAPIVPYDLPRQAQIGSGDET